MWENRTGKYLLLRIFLGLPLKPGSNYSSIMRDKARKVLVGSLLPDYLIGSGFAAQKAMCFLSSMLHLNYQFIAVKMVKKDFSLPSHEIFLLIHKLPTVVIKRSFFLT